MGDGNLVQATRKVEVNTLKQLNYDFLEAYKALDKLCGDMYHSKFGVTNYIDHMKEETYNGGHSIAYWDFILDRLIHYRHIRNKLTHDVGSFETVSCSQSDINWILDFHESILKRTDPVSELLRKRVREKQAQKERERIVRKEQIAEADMEMNPKTSKFFKIILTALSLILLFIIINLLKFWL